MSATRADALVLNWAGLLRGIAWSGKGSTRRPDALAALIGLNPRELTGEQASRLKAATRELAAFLQETDAPQNFGRGSETFLAWIHRRFVASGPDLLLSQEQRRASLALLRDQDRRAVHSAQGWQAARIEMQAEEWKKLKKLKLEWKLNSLGATIGLLLDLNGKAVRRSSKGNGSSRRGKQAPDLPLFSKLEKEND